MRVETFCCRIKSNFLFQKWAIKVNFPTANSQNLTTQLDCLGGNFSILEYQLRIPIYIFFVLSEKRPLLTLTFSEYLYFAAVNSFKFTSLAFQMNGMKSSAIWKVRTKRGKFCHGRVFAPLEKFKTQTAYDKMLIDLDWVRSGWRESIWLSIRTQDLAQPLTGAFLGELVFRPSPQTRLWGGTKYELP